MPEIKKILVPVDFSVHSDRAVDYAVELAQSFGAGLILLHCYRFDLYDVAVYDPPYIADLPKEFDASVRDAAARKLSKLRDDVAQRGVQVQDRLSELRAFDGILRAADETSADLIVMGTRGLSGLKHVLLGSVAERTVRMAPCPVLTVKVEGPDPTAG